MLRNPLQRSRKITAGFAGKDNGLGELVEDLWELGDSTGKILSFSHLIENALEHLLKLEVFYV